MNKHDCACLPSHVPAELHPLPKERLRRWLAFLMLLVASLLFRLPALLNASGVHSDAAIVGLQGRHILQGEWSWFLWGAGYQGSLDALLIAMGFAIAGATPLALMAVPLIGHLLLTWFVFDVLHKRINHWSAVVATLPVVFAPQAINGVALYAPRQWCITVVFAAIWLLDGANGSRLPLLRYGAGMMMGVLSLYLDLYAMQFLVGLAAFAVACSLDGGARSLSVLKRMGACTLGFAIGIFLVWLSRQSPVATTSKTILAPERIPQNIKLLWEMCLPWLLGYEVFIPGKNLYPDRWDPPAVFHAIQLLGAILFVLGVLFGGTAVFLWRVPWRVRRLGGLGFLVAACSLVGFLVSVMPSDMWSTRYLAPFVWTAPFGIAPAAYVLGQRRFGLALAPYLVVAMVGGWLSFGPYVRGPLPVLDARGVARDEAQLGIALRQRGVRYATAEYWLSYRLTFLWAENPIVIPLNSGQDRYVPYRRAFDAAPIVAFIFHPSEPRARPEPYETWLRESRAQYERVEVAGFTVLILHR